MVERPDFVGAAAVIRDDDRVDAGLGGDLGVFPGQDAFDDHFHLGQVAQPFDVVPAHGR